MSQSTATRLLTAAEFMALPDDGRRIELWQGVVVEMSPANLDHGWLMTRLAATIYRYTVQRGLGQVLSGDPGIQIDRGPDTVLAPDVAVYVGRPMFEPFGRGAGGPIPEVIAEIASPSDRPRQLRTKAQRWLGAGVQEVWIVWPEERSIEIHVAHTEPRTVVHPDSLTCELLPGFELPLAELFGP